MDTFNAYDTESITVAGTAVGFTLATLDPDGPEKPDIVKFQVETAQIRFTVDGTTPTSSIGLIGDVGDLVTITGVSDAKGFLAIRTGGTSATIQPVYSVKE